MTNVQCMWLRRLCVSTITIETRKQCLHVTPFAHIKLWVFKIIHMKTGWCKMQTVDCKLQGGGKIQTEGKIKTVDQG